VGRPDEQTVIELHKQDIIWGDAKPDNIVIDECDNAWLIDFAGGFTEPWVDRKLCESCEGDLQAVGKIKRSTPRTVVFFSTNRKFPLWEIGALSDFKRRRCASSTPPHQNFLGTKFAPHCDFSNPGCKHRNAYN